MKIQTAISFFRSIGHSAWHCVKFCRHYGWTLALREAKPFITEAIYGSEQRAEQADAFDARHGTDTSSMVMPWDLPSLAAADPQVYHYETLPSAAIRSILTALPVNIENFVLVDLGCGKGRVLMVAAEFPFAQIVGVELATELAQIARENVRRYRASQKACREIVIQQGDALAYEFPLQPLVVFLFNPFGSQTLKCVCRNLKASLRHVPRPAYVIYVNPLHQNVIRAFPEFCRVDSPPEYSVYRLVL